MSLTPQYINFLEIFKSTSTIYSLHTNPNVSNLIGLRHDVDHSIDVALEMAFWEAERNIQSTYFVLPKTKYWDEDPLFLEKCLQIQDWGHEIGLHINTIADWYEGRISNPAESFSNDVRKLKEAGINVKGIAAHGDVSCYKNNFINYWAFKELRPTSPHESETYLTAEGIPSPNKNRFISYNYTDDVITRPDGETFTLWSIPFSDYGIEYHATHISTDAYFTDSGGGWNVTEAPTSQNLMSGRHQVNMHPEHWKTDRQLIFILSPARSSSKWISQLIDKATSLSAKHEHFLNFRYSNKIYKEDHITGIGYANISANKPEMVKRIREARNWLIESQIHDYCEVNVYLEHHFPQLKETFPSATFIFLERKPDKVVTSIMNRNWFDTANDDRHPTVPNVNDWETLSPFERCCYYVSNSQAKLRSECDFIINSENATTDLEYLQNFFKSINVAFYPRLATSLINNKVNANTNTGFPQRGSWPEKYELAYNKILGDKHETSENFPNIFQKLNSVFLAPYHIYFSKIVRHKILLKDLKNDANLTLTKNASLSNSTIKLNQNDNLHEYIKFNDFIHLSQAQQEFEINMHFSFLGSPNALAQVLLFGYDKEHEQVEKRILGRVKTGQGSFKLRFTPGFSSQVLSLLIQVPRGYGKSELTISDLSIVIPLSRADLLKYKLTNSITIIKLCRSLINRIEHKFKRS